MDGARKAAIPDSIRDRNAILIARAALEKGFEITPIARNFFIVAGNGKVEYFFGSMASSISHLAKSITWDKALTKKFLQMAGVPTPPGVVFKKNNIEKAARYLRSSSATSFVLKPTDGLLGRAVFMGITSEQSLRQKHSLIPPRYKKLLLEEQVPGVEARYFVVGDQMVAAAVRKPANVIGDGVSTLRELVSKKNSQRIGHAALKQIKIESETKELIYSQGLGLDSIPAEGRTVTLKRVSNISQGGDSIDITDEVHDDMKALAISALQSVPTLSYAGLDVIAESHFSSLSGQKAVVLEINWQPMIRLHHAPAIGMKQDVAGAIIDHLFKD